MSVNSEFQGGWSLQRFDKIGANGEVEQPLGSRPNGMISYTADGAMSVQLLSGDGNVSRGIDAISCYSGRYDVDAESGIVRHHVESASVEGLPGTVQKRNFRFAGDRLILSTVLDGSHFELEWKKISSGNEKIGGETNYGYSVGWGGTRQDEDGDKASRSWTALDWDHDDGFRSFSA